ncbi:MAG: hypothetical protein ABSH36_10860 [Solirubrobacteraceae bacterium]
MLNTDVVPRLLTRGFGVLVVVAFLVMLAAGHTSADVTGAADDLRTGWYPDEPSLTPALVAGGSFQQAFDRTLPGEGQIYAQPLVADNTLLVATEDDRAFGLDPVTGEIRWEREFGEPAESERDPEINCEDLAPNVGITGTPVIDTETNIAYFTSNSYITKEEKKEHPGRPIAWYMQAVEMSNGKEAPGFPVEIAGEADNIPGVKVKFSAPKELQRPALLLMNGVVYAGFGSHCDNTPFQGWLVGVSAAEHRITTMWATAEDGGSIWQSGGGLISDGPGQILFATGNGPGDGAEAFPLPGPGDKPPEGRLAESVVRVEVQPEGSLKATDFFSPYNNKLFDEKDRDLGSAAPIALPSQYFGTKQAPDLLLQASKQGGIYLLNRDDLGGVAQGPEEKDDVVQTLKGGGVWDGAALWPGDGGYIYVPSVSPGEEIGASNGYLRTFKYGVEQATEEPNLSLAAISPETYGFGSGSPIVTSNGTTGGTAILWLTQCPPTTCEGAKLRAYDAVPSEAALQLLWEAPIGTATKFSRPDAADGHIYLGNRGGHIFGYSAPQLTPSTTSLNLGTALTGAQLTGEVTLTNTGPATLTVGPVRAPTAPFEATGLPKEGAVIEQGQTITVHVAFRSATPGSFKGSLILHTAAGETGVALSGSAVAPPPEEPTPPHEQGATGTSEQGKAGTTSLASSDPLGPSLTLSEPLVSLTHPHLAYPASKRGRGHRELRLAFTLSAAGTVQIAIDRRVLSHNCQRGVRACIHDVPTSVKLKVAGHAGRNTVTVNLAGLPAGAYRVALAPRARSGAAGSARYIDFKTLR